MKGKVRKFISNEQHGWIEGFDGNSYYVHIADVKNHEELVFSQDVEFEPFLGPKGLRAKNVVPGRRPERIYVNPDHFIMTREDHVRGCQTVAIIGSCWGESNDPNKAKERLKDAALQLGANAVISMILSKHTANQACSNYQYTMHRFCGDAVVVKRIEYSSDPDKCAASRAEMSRYRNFTPRLAIGNTELVRPCRFVLYSRLAFSWCCTLLSILRLSAMLLTNGVLRKRDKSVWAPVRWTDARRPSLAEDR